ncbi:aluminum-activated malate transporter 4-like [Oryza brachyantha]|uniref:aluminum-activated malate transporter 4-like n=1 Tax=Oryza brachyantha TaxID=4533 RepID=UPI0003EAD4BA|nr:aluminum-activated malate transporter 4-like [Oryza brachyantha]
MSRIDSKGGVDGGVTVDVTLSPNAVLPGFAKRPPDATGAGRSSCRGFPRRARAAAAEVWAFASDGAGCRVAFALKAGIAMLLASLLALAGEPFRLFGTNIVWSILTVGIMFEYTVGASFNRGFNRAVGSTVAGVVAIVVIWVSLRCGSVAEPYVIGLSIFLIGAVTSFVKQLPALAPYEHGFRVILFTYCLIVVSAYRVREPIAAALDRLYAIAIGAALALLVNVLVFPAWAGEQLHRELVASFAAVADSLHDCVRCYLTGDETIDDGGLSGGSEPSIEKCRATLNASARIDSLANSARWEPPHGRFRTFSFPWSHYARVGAVLRHCAYEVVAMHGCLRSEIQAPDGVREAFRAEIKDAAEQAADLVRSMGSDVDGMTRSSAERLSLLKGVHGSAYRLQLALALNSQLLVSSGSESEVNETSGLQERSCSRLRESTRRQRLSWPSREADELEEMEAGGGYAAMVRMRALKSTRALSLATFASLLLEFVARLDHLVDTVDDLSKLAKFREESDPM